jgi:hypothetical protein
MSELVTDIVFSSGQNGATPNKLNLAWSRAKVSPELISNKPSEAGPVAGGYVLELNASGQLVKVPATSFGGSHSSDTAPYKWSTAITATDPGSGDVQGNNAVISSITHIYVSTFDQTGAGVFALLQLVDGNDLYLYQTNAVNASVHYRVVGTPVNNGPNIWFDITVSLVALNGFAPGNNQSVQLYIPGTGTAINAGNWAAFTYQTGWSESANARYRLETITGGATTIQRVYCRGAIQKALGSSAILALVFPAGFRPSALRQFVLGGFQTGDTDDKVLYHGLVDMAGNFEIRPMVKYSFVWPILTDTQTIYLDGMSFDL